MSSDAVISVDSLGKRYRIGVAQKRAKNLSEALRRSLVSPFQYLRRKMTGATDAEILWALKDVSFEVGQGEVLGIIGRNGAGKSTLLKILSRITDPTEGRAIIRGRVNSLLEVGTGFHPELTGRENIYMNAAMHGMRRAEINRKLDEIIAFAEVERFVDTPVKRYSSGMYTRLAFAVAAHLEPEILLVDEVLAVGDASFQRKCLQKMEDVGREGRTVLFVSHNMSAVTALCSRVILIEKGRVAKDGAAADVTAAYLQTDTGSTAHRQWATQGEAPGDASVRLLSVRVRDRKGETVENVEIAQSVGIEIRFRVLQPALLLPCINAVTEQGVYAFFAGSTDARWRRERREAGDYTAVVWIPGNLLAEGVLRIDVAVNRADPFHQYAFAREAVAFHVYDSRAGDNARGDFSGRLPGVVRPLLEWDDRRDAS